MDTHYQPMYRQAALAQNKFHNYTHASAADPYAKVMRNEIHKLTNDLASGRDPRRIDTRLRTIQTQLQRSQRMQQSTGMPGQVQSPILNYQQSQQLHSHFQSMRNNIRQHPNY